MPENTLIDAIMLTIYLLKAQNNNRKTSHISSTYYKLPNTHQPMQNSLPPGGGG